VGRGPYEWNEVAILSLPLWKKIIEESYADNSKLKTKISWNYNWKVKLITHNSVDYVLALPSLIAIDLSDTSDDNLQNIITNKKLTYNWYNSLPASYWNQTPPSEWAFDFVPNC
jgi:hypothetical protein